MSAELTTKGGGPDDRPRMRVGLGPSKSSSADIWSPGILILWDIREPRLGRPLGVAGDAGRGAARHPMLLDAVIGEDIYSASWYVHDGAGFGVLEYGV